MTLSCPQIQQWRLDLKMTYEGFSLGKQQRNASELTAALLLPLSRT